MFAKYFFALMAVVVFVAAINAVPVDHHEENEEESDVETRLPLLLPATVAILKSAGISAAASCLTEAAKACKGDWKSPSKLVSCAKNFVQTNKGRCLLG